MKFNVIRHRLNFSHFFLILHLISLLMAAYTLFICTILYIKYQLCFSSHHFISKFYTYQIIFRVICIFFSISFLKYFFHMNFTKKFFNFNKIKKCDEIIRKFLSGSITDGLVSSFFFSIFKYFFFHEKNGWISLKHFHSFFFISKKISLKNTCL